jgi:hypothetical protein
VSDASLLLFLHRLKLPLLRAVSFNGMHGHVPGRMLGMNIATDKSKSTAYDEVEFFPFRRFVNAGGRALSEIRLDHTAIPAADLLDLLSKHHKCETSYPD